MQLTCADEVVRYVGETVRDALADPAVGRRPGRIRFGLVDPDCVLTVDLGQGEVTLGCGPGVVDGLVAMSAATALGCCQGLVDVAAALRSGEIVADGDCQVLLDLLGAQSPLPVAYLDVVRRAGRSDLLPALAVAG